MVERVLVVPPTSRIGPATPEERQAIAAQSPVKGKYETAIDRESAYEILTARTNTEPAEPAPRAAPQAPERPVAGPDGYPVARESGGGPGRNPAPRAGGRARESVTEAFAKSAVRAIGSSVGRQIARGILGAMLKGR
jgi:hypothetical protein